MDVQVLVRIWYQLKWYQIICMTDNSEITAQFPESIYGAGFWHMCHGHYTVLLELAANLQIAD